MAAGRFFIITQIIFFAAPGCTLISDDAEVLLELSHITGIPDRYCLYYPGVEEEFWDGSPLRITIPKENNMPVIACLRSTGICAAGFFPEDVRNGTLRLSWEKGPLGCAVRRLYANGAHIEILDLSVIQEKILKAGEGNPWLCDMDTIVLSLCYKGRAPGYIPVAETHNLKLTGGRWPRCLPGRSLISANPFMDDITSIETGCEVMEGISWYFAREEICILEADSTGWTLTAPFISFSESGCW